MKSFFERVGTALKQGAVSTLSGARRRWLFLVIAAGVILLDQITKQLALRYLYPVDTVPLWQDVLHLTYVENRGAAFGMLANNRAVFLVISSVAIPVMLVYLLIRRERTPLLDLGLAFIIGGGIGNMIDRLGWGYVIDFIDFRLINFAVFNAADSFVCVGAGLMILALMLDMIRETRAAKVPSDEHDPDRDI